MTTTLKFLYRQLFVTPPKASPSQIDLRGQTGIVTGSNIGLGLEASRQLLGLGLSYLILAVRDQSKGEAARRDLASTAPNARIEVWDLDLANYSSVQNFAKRSSTLPRLDFAILNAGVIKTKHSLCQSTGHEEVVQVNYLSTALLTVLLLPVLDAKRASPDNIGRITIVGSETADWAKFKEQEARSIISALDDPQNFDMEDRYYTSKLLEEFFLLKLAHSVPSTKAVVNIVNPGLCYGSGLHTDITGPIGIIIGLYKRLIGRSTSIGARTLVDGAAVQGNDTHGKYLSDCRVQKMAPMTEGKKGESVMEKLWSELMAEFSFANAEEILEKLK